MYLSKKPKGKNVRIPAMYEHDNMTKKNKP